MGLGLNSTKNIPVTLFAFAPVKHKSCKRPIYFEKMSYIFADFIIYTYIYIDLGHVFIYNFGQIGSAGLQIFCLNLVIFTIFVKVFEFSWNIVVFVFTLSLDYLLVYIKFLYMNIILESCCIWTRVLIYIYIHTHTHTHTHIYKYLYKYDIYNINKYIYVDRVIYMYRIIYINIYRFKGWVVKLSPVESIHLQENSMKNITFLS